MSAAATLTHADRRAIARVDTAMERIRKASVKPGARLYSSTRCGSKFYSTLYELRYDSEAGAGELFASADVEEFCEVCKLAVREFRKVRDQRDSRAPARRNTSTSASVAAR
jgi:hypothetical protein